MAWKALCPGLSHALRPRADATGSTLSAEPGGLDGRARSGEREGSEEVLNEINRRENIELRLGAPAEALAPRAGVL